MIETGNSSAGRVRQTDFGAFDLMPVAPALKLTNDLNRLGGARSSDWVPTRQQPAGRIDRQTTAE